MSETSQKLLVVELWGMGDLALATPFLRGAVARYESVCLLAKPVASDLQPVLWPGASVEKWSAPWTAFRGKYRLWAWPWGEMRRLRSAIKRGGFKIACGARRDPRDHLLLRFLGVEGRIGFPTKGSGAFLTDCLPPPPPLAHRTEGWKRLAERLGVRWSPANLVAQTERRVLIHTGAAQKVRVWPLTKYGKLATRLVSQGWAVEVACDADQASYWRGLGTVPWATVDSVGALLERMGRAGAFIGNDSGPGHVAAALGVPTFTIFGNQRPEWFLPDHPLAAHVPGRPCDFKPCFDACRFAEPRCLWDVSEDEVVQNVLPFLAKAFSGSR